MRPSEALERHRAAIAAVIARYPVSEPRVFGSTSRGEDTDSSDLDILVKPTGSLSFIDLARLEIDLESLCGVTVDVRTESEFSPDTLKTLAADIRAL